MKDLVFNKGKSKNICPKECRYSNGLGQCSRYVDGLEFAGYDDNLYMRLSVCINDEITYINSEKK